jgi:hypothetical protein
MPLHFRRVCSCGTVIAQCRCPGTKTTTIVPDGCQTCARRAANVAEIEDGLAPLPKTTADFVTIRWQEGPVKEVGANGAQVEDVLRACLSRLRELNHGPDYNAETTLAEKSLDTTIRWLDYRTFQRTERGVEGTSKP